MAGGAPSFVHLRTSSTRVATSRAADPAEALTRGSTPSARARRKSSCYDTIALESGTGNV